MFRDGIFNNFGEFLDSIKESTGDLNEYGSYPDTDEEMGEKVVELLADEGYVDEDGETVGANILPLIMELIGDLSEESKSDLNDAIRFSNPEDIFIVLKELQSSVRKNEGFDASKLKESTYTDFIENYGKELSNLIKKVDVYFRYESSSKSSEELEQLADKLEQRLSPYDNEVKNEIVELVLFSGPTANTKEDLIKLAMDIQNRHGTEPKQVINALEDAVGGIDPEDYVEANESKLSETDRKEAEQTEMPKEETPEDDAERLSMEDWSDTDKDGKPKRKDKVEYPSKLYEPTDKELSDEIKYERKSDPLYLCNECFKTFRCNEAKCKCGSENVERISKVRERESKIKKYKAIVEAENFEVEDAVQLSHKRDIDYKIPGFAKGTIRQKLENDRFLVFFTWNILGKSLSQLTNLAADDIEKVEEPKVKEEKGTVSFLKKPYRINYTTRDGAVVDTTVMGFDEDDAKKYVEKWKKGSTVNKVEKVKESKVNETVQELIGETPGINVQEQEILNWAIDQNVIPNVWPSDEVMIDSLADEGILPRTPSDVEDETGLDLGEIPAVYLKYILLPKAKNEWEKASAPAELESKIKEKLSPEAMKELGGPKLKFDYGTVVEHKKIMEDLSQTDFFKTTMVGTQVTLVDAKGFPVTYAKDEDTVWKPWTDMGFVGESKLDEKAPYVAVRNYEDGIALVIKDGGPERILTKYPTNEKEDAVTKGQMYAGSWDIEFKDLTETIISEQDEDNYTTVAKGIEDEATAKEVAQDKKGQVIADPEDPKKFAVIMKKE